jgi:hypothetical protein
VAREDRRWVSRAVAEAEVVDEVVDDSRLISPFLVLKNLKPPKKPRNAPN